MSAQTSFDARLRRGFCFFLLMALDLATVFSQIGCSLDLSSFGSPNIIQRSGDKCDQTSPLVLGFYSFSLIKLSIFNLLCSVNSKPPFDLRAKSIKNFFVIEIDAIAYFATRLTLYWLSINQNESPKGDFGNLCESFHCHTSHT